MKAASIECERQAALLLELLPTVARQPQLALYGGTAINFFLQDAPRLSVDLDLKLLLPLDPDAARPVIDEILQGMGADIRRDIPGILIEWGQERTGRQPRLFAIREPDEVRVKIEVNPLQTGSIFRPEMRRLSEAVASGFAAAVPPVRILSPAETYAGKVGAALERAYARDLYDIWRMPEAVWEDGRLWAAIAVALAMSRRRDLCECIAGADSGPATAAADHENLVPMMRTCKASVQELEDAGRRLRTRVRTRMPSGCRRLLIDFFRGRADWSAVGVDIDRLPGLQWRSETIRRLDGRRKEMLAARWSDALFPRPDAGA